MYLMNGANIAEQGNVYSKPPVSWTLKTVSDFNGDGKADMLWERSNGEGWISIMNGKSVLSETNAYSISAGSGWSTKLFEDFNGDGKADILWEHTDGTGYIYLMNGAAIASSGYSYKKNDVNWQILKSGDFDGNGKKDILWENSASGVGCIYLMNGISISSYQDIYTLKDINPATKWNVVKILDFNGDGKSDMLWESAGSRKALVYIMNGFAISATGTVYSNGTGWQIIP